MVVLWQRNLLNNSSLLTLDLVPMDILHDLQCPDQRSHKALLCEEHKSNPTHY
jgi:hypothetical protein